MRYLRRRRIKVDETLWRLLLEYKRDHGHSTISAAARDMMNRQGYYSRWKRSRTGKVVREEQELRHIAREILKEHPDATRAQLGFNMMKRAGELVNAPLVRRIAEEMVDSH